MVGRSQKLQISLDINKSLVARTTRLSAVWTPWSHWGFLIRKFFTSHSLSFSTNSTLTPQITKWIFGRKSKTSNLYFPPPFNFFPNLLTFTTTPDTQYSLLHTHLKTFSSFLLLRSSPYTHKVYCEVLQIDNQSKLSDFKLNYWKVSFPIYFQLQFHLFLAATKMFFIICAYFPSQFRWFDRWKDLFWIESKGYFTDSWQDYGLFRVWKLRIFCGNVIKQFQLWYSTHSGIFF